MIFLVHKIIFITIQTCSNFMEIQDHLNKQQLIMCSYIVYILVKKRHFYDTINIYNIQYRVLKFRGDFSILTTDRGKKTVRQKYIPRFFLTGPP